MGSPAAYAIYSAALHADWHSVVANYQEAVLADGSKAWVARPDRVAVWSAVLVAAAPAVYPAIRALQLLDHRARLLEVKQWMEGVFALMRRMDLPTEWWTLTGLR
jgi:hypothetical protein